MKICVKSNGKLPIVLHLPLRLLNSKLVRNAARWALCKGGQASDGYVWERKQMEDVCNALRQAAKECGHFDLLDVHSSTCHVRLRI